MTHRQSLPNPTSPRRVTRSVVTRLGTLWPLLLCSGCLEGVDVTASAPDQELPDQAALPQEGVHFTAEVAIGETEETLKAVSAPTLSAPEMVEFPYDPQQPDAEDPEPATVEVRSACVTKTYDLASNPTQVLLHGVDSAISWPGALLQGDPYRDGTLRSLNLRAEDRAPLTVVIKDVYNASGSSSSRSVDGPTFAAVTDAVSDMVVTGYEDDLPIGGGVDYTYAETKDVSRFMLKAGVSARYGAFSGSLSTSINQSSSHRTVIVHLVQKLFDVEVQEPSSQQDWFEQSFFDEGLAEKMERGEISDVNPPVYVSKVTYGRMLTYTLTSTASSSDLRAMVRASVDTLVAGGSLSLESKLSKVQESTEVSMVSIGGNQTTALTAAQSGDWGSFFQEDLKLTTAAPIAIEFKNLYDNTPAGVSEVGTYDEQVCTPQISVPGPFDFALEDAHVRPEAVGNIQEVVTGDFNGDGAVDLLWNHLIQNDNNSYVGFGSTEGRLRIDAAACGGAVCEFSDDQTPWGQFRPIVGDFNGDARSDVAWVPKAEFLGDLGYTAYVLMATDEGFADELVRQTLAPASADFSGAQQQVLARDMNGDGADDLVFWFVTRNSVPQTVQEFQILRATPDAASGNPFALDPRVGGFAATDVDYPNTELIFDVQDLNSDGLNDLVLGLMGQEFAGSEFTDERNVTGWYLNQHVAGRDAVEFSESDISVYGSRGGWSAYRAVYGDFDGDGDSDAAWIRSRDGQEGAVHQASFDSGKFVEEPTLQWWTDNGAATVIEQAHSIDSIDVNGDAAMDVVANAFQTVGGVAVVNSIAVMPGVRGASPMFNTSVAPQVHPVSQDWQSYTYTFVGDFNGDGTQDMLWNNAALDNSVYIAFAARADIE